MYRGGGVALFQKLGSSKEYTILLARRKYNPEIRKMVNKSIFLISQVVEVNVLTQCSTFLLLP